MGMREWWQGHRDLEMGMRAQGWSLSDRILGHVADDLARVGEEQEAGPDWTEERLAAQGARDEQEMDAPGDYGAELARELIDRYGAGRMREVVQRLGEVPLHELAQMREHDEMPEEMRAAVDERIDRASTQAARDFLHAAEQGRDEDGVDQESGITGVESGDGEWLDYRDPEMEAPITAVDDGEGGVLQYAAEPASAITGVDDTGPRREAGQERAEWDRAQSDVHARDVHDTTPEDVMEKYGLGPELPDTAQPVGDRVDVEAIDDIAVTPELADEVARPSETTMAAQDAVQAEAASTGAEMSAEPGGLELSGGIQPGVSP